MPRGRPKTAAPRDMMITVRVTKPEYDQLKLQSMRTGQSMGEIIRALIADNNTTSPPHEAGSQPRPRKGEEVR